jgi:hypothetical protein
MPITETSYFIGNSRWNPSRENYRPKGVNVPVGLLPGQANRVLEQAVHAAQSRTARQSSCLEFGLTGGCGADKWHVGCCARKTMYSPPKAFA